MRPAALLLLLGAACTPAPDTPTLRVLAASSLQDAYTDLGARFEGQHPGTRVELVFAGSQTLETQVRQGLVADVLTTASHEHVARLQAEGLAHGGAPVCTNRIVLALGPGAAPGMDLARLPEAERLVLGHPAVPLGRYTDLLLAATGARLGPDWSAAVAARVVSREPSARRVAAKLALREADAAFVYATDVGGLPSVRAIPLAEDSRSPTPTYVAAVLTAAPLPDLAQAWVDLSRSDEGQAVLVSHGFRPAPP